MKAAVFYGEKDIRVKDIEQKKPKDNEVLIKVEACGVCGTDMHIFAGAEGAAKTNPPLVLGHEFSGIVCETGKNVKNIKSGDRVCVDPNDMCGECYYCRQGKAHFCENMIGIGTTVDGGFAEYCTVREKQVYKISDNLSYVEAAMAEPLACCLHGMDLTGVIPGQTVMIVGGGTIGLIMLQLAKISGAAIVIVAEPVAAKRGLARKLGADIAFDPNVEDIAAILNQYSIDAIDAAVECVGLKNTMLYTINNTGKGGISMLFGLTSPESQIEIKPFEIFKREITIKASFINPYTHTRAVSLLAAGKIEVHSLITDEVKLDHILDVFETDKYKGRGKIIVKP